MAGTRLIVPPAAEPVTVDFMRELLRYPPADQDAVIASLIAAARQATEDYTGRAWMTQTWEQAADTWPTADGLVLEHPPLQAVTKVTVFSPDAPGVDLDPSTYYVDAWSTPARLFVAAGPQALRAAAGVVVTLVVGYADMAAEVPAVLDHIATLVMQGFQRRPPAVSDVELAWPATVRDGLRPYRVEYPARLVRGSGFSYVLD